MSTAISRAYFAADANGHYRPYYAAASDYREAIDATKADDAWYEDHFAVDRPAAESREPAVGPGNATH
ncbi:MAG: hypothetical protein HY329_07935 [Chloroflexi bacterium]|nr:hypothetical protein [Chloroflexota bacterium]